MITPAEPYDSVKAAHLPGGARHQQVFPKLDDEQFAILQRYGVQQYFSKGAILFRQGERHISMYVVLTGEIEIVRNSALSEQLVGRFGPGMFTGEVGTLAGRGAIATARALTDCDLLIIEEPALRSLVIAEAQLSELIMRAYILRRVAFIDDQYGAVILLGSVSSPETLRLREFMVRNGQPAAYFDIDEHAEASALMARFGVTPADIPVIVTPEGTVLRRPTLRELADASGISADGLDQRDFDVVVVGAGPGGLAAAVYAASEGLSVAVLDAKAPGGQAGSSSKIENYFGFPTGISGLALAGRGLSQARKFGAEVAVPVEVRKLDCGGSIDHFTLQMDSGEQVHARAIVIATGARYRKPALPRLEHFEGRGVYYNASFMEATFCSDDEVIVVGGGNSAGQAAVFLSRYARHVHMLVRGEGLAASMSHYLIQRIAAAPTITLHPFTQIVALHGNAQLAGVDWQRHAEPVQSMPIRHVFLFLGAEPNTAWLNGCVALDDHNFVLTGAEIPPGAWPAERTPHFLETSRPGIFSVGDVRSGSVKRVATAVGEGAAAVQYLHQVLSLTPDAAK